MKYRKKDKNGKTAGGHVLHRIRIKMQTACHCIPPLPAYWLPLEWEIWRRQMQLAEPLRDSFGVNTTITGVVVALVVFIVLSGGIQRIAKVTEKVVPYYGGYLSLAGIIVIAVHGTMLPSVFGQIFSGAFNLQSATGASAVLL